MNKYREKVSRRGTADCPVSRYPVIRQEPGASFANIHWHPETEIIYMKEGSVMMRIGRQTFPLLAGQIAFVSPGQLHTIWGIEPNSRIDSVVFSLELLTLPESHFFQRDMIAPLISGSIRFPYVIRNNDAAYPVVSNLIKEMHAAEKNSSKYKPIIFSSLVQLFTAMMDFMEPSSIGLPQHPNEAIKSCLEFMNHNYSQRITLQEIAAQAHLHRNYLCALFKEYTGQTVFQHLTQIRVEAAAKLLRTQSLSVSRIASMCGFESTSFFSKKFKAIMGTSPKEYNMQHHKKHS